MRVVTFKRIKEYGEIHPEADTALRNWYHIVSKKNWKNFYDVKSTFNSVDSVGNHRYVFHFKGNHYRIVVIISFNAQKVYVRFIGTHKDYDAIKSIETI